MRPPQHRRCVLEQLEPRTLLAGLTVITHGNSGATPLDAEFPAWVTDMALAINARLPEPCDTTVDGDHNGIPETIQNARVGLAGAPPAGGCNQFLLFDWHERSTLITPGTANENGVAGRLAALVQARLPDTGRLDLHFIGFSRGAYVNNEVIRLLGDDARIGWLQMTTLDSQAVGAEGTLAVHPNVDWADNYFQRDQLDAVNGAVLQWAVNVEVTGAVIAWPGRSNFSPSPSHEEVRDWYHWTINTDDRTIPQLAYADPDLVTQQAQFVREASAGLTTTRTLLFTGLGVDLNGVLGPDWLAWGAQVGFYHSLAGGGMGTVIHDGSGALFTVDLRDGTTPIFLGRMGAVMFDMAFDAAGQLYGIDGTSGLYTVGVRFDRANRPQVTTTFRGDLQVFANALEFRDDGTLFAAGYHSVYTVNVTNGVATRVFTLPSQYASAGDLDFDADGNLYLTTTSGSLIHIDPSLSRWEDLGSTGVGDLFGLVFSPEGTLSGFSNRGQIHAVNPEDASAQRIAWLSSVVQGVYGAATVPRPWLPPPAARGSIGGTVFHDRDGDGVRDPDEPGLPAWTFFADANGDGVLNNPVGGTGTCGAGATEFCGATGTDGRYVLGSLRAGTYPVRAVRPAGWLQTTVDATDVVLTDGADRTGVDIGVAIVGRIEGHVFLDVNRNGARDRRERLLRRWTVFLDANANGRLDAGERTTVTTARGFYAFSDLAPGAYAVALVPRRGFASGQPVVTVRSGETASAADVAAFRLRPSRRVTVPAQSHAPDVLAARGVRRLLTLCPRLVDDVLGAFSAEGSAWRKVL